MVDNKKSIIISLILSIVLIGISIPIWNTNEFKVGAEVADSYKDMNISISYDGLDNIIILSDSSSDMINYTDVVLRNPTSKLKQYNFIFVYNKSSSVPYQAIRINIDGNIHKLDKMEYSEDKDNMYFILDSSNINSYSNKIYKVKIWLSDEYDIDLSSNLTSAFVAR